MTLCNSVAQPLLVSMNAATQTTKGPGMTNYAFVASDTDGATDLMGINVLSANRWPSHGYQRCLWHDRQHLAIYSIHAVGQTLRGNYRAGTC
jgi:hypothetical protein